MPDDDYFIFDGYKIKRCCEDIETIINDADAAWISDDGKLCIEHDICENGECISEEWDEIEVCFACDQEIVLEKIELPFYEDPVIINNVIDSKKWTYGMNKRVKNREEKLPKKLRNGWK